MVRPSGDGCNMRCKYCYVPGGDSPYVGLMKLETFQQSIRLALNYAKRSAPFNLEILFHGGEPLLWGIENYTKALEYISKLGDGLKDSVKIRIKLQTNGTLLDDNFASLFGKHNVYVGISLDGPKEIHDKLRVYPNNKGSYDDVIRAVRLLRKHQRHIGAIMVVTKYHLGKEQELYNFFKENGLGLQPSPLIMWGRAKIFSNLYITPQEYLKFMRNLLDIWIKDGDPIDIPIFMKAVQAIVLEKPVSYCHMSIGCAKTRHFLAIDWDGTVSLCNRTASLHVPDFMFGNIHNVNDLEEIFTHSNFVKLVERAETLRNTRCNSCPLHRKGLCGGGGGCPFLAYINGNLDAVPPSCDYEKQLIEMVIPYVIPYKKEAKELLERWLESEEEVSYL